MADTIAPHTVLSDSMFKTRPGSFIFFRSDANAGLNAAQASKREWLEKQMKFPQLNGKKDVGSFENMHNPDNPSFIKWHNEGDFRSQAPRSTIQNFFDPISGFVSVGWESEMMGGKSRSQSVKRFCDTPQSYNPREYHSNRLACPSAPSETRRATENDPGTPYRWNSKVLTDREIRTELTALNYPSSAQLKTNEVPAAGDEAKKIRDKLALRFRYTSSTQQAYGDVPWDSTSPCRRWAPVSTLEAKADPVALNSPDKRFEPAAADWQCAGGTWDRFQTRKGHFKPKEHTPVPGIDFCSPYPRAQQIPSYSGCIGAENIQEIDNRAEPFHPFTVKRVNPLPPDTETSHRPNIPGYTGSTNYWAAPRSDLTIKEVNLHDRPATTGAPNSRNGTMSKMVTLVDPCNPFNSVNKEPIIVK